MLYHVYVFFIRTLYIFLHFYVMYFHKKESPRIPLVHGGFSPVVTILLPL